MLSSVIKFFFNQAHSKYVLGWFQLIFIVTRLYHQNGSIKSIIFQTKQVPIRFTDERFVGWKKTTYQTSVNLIGTYCTGVCLRTSLLIFQFTRRGVYYMQSRYLHIRNINSMEKRPQQSQKNHVPKGIAEFKYQGIFQLHFTSSKDSFYPYESNLIFGISRDDLHQM